MTDHEFLLEISNIVRTNTKSLEYRMEQLEQKIDTVENKLSNRIDEVESKLSNRIDEVENKLSFDVKRILIDIENDIKPRLTTIENCYIDTNKRHNANIEKIENLEMNMDIVQSVLKDHIQYINQQIA